MMVWVRVKVRVRVRVRVGVRVRARVRVEVRNLALLIARAPSGLGAHTSGEPKEE